MSGFLKKIFIAQILVVTFLLILVLRNQNDIQLKLENTNKLLFNNTKKLQFSDLLKRDSVDIIFGKKESVNSLIVYLKYGCDACNEYYTKTLSQFTIKELDSLDLSITYRFLAHESHPKILKFSEMAYQSYCFGNFLEFMNKILIRDYSLKKSINQLKLESKKCEKNYNYHFSEYILNKAKEARQLNISLTPTSFVNGTRVIGSVSKSHILDVLTKK
tara:strand:+ start:123 stop:773 length:651 start_codon:yes stop_codon:yes gene_type:complete